MHKAIIVEISRVGKERLNRTQQESEITNIVNSVCSIVIDILTQVEPSLPLETLKTVTNKLKGTISSSFGSKVEPITDILKAASNSLKPMTIHYLVIQNIRNTLEDVSSIIVQTTGTIDGLPDDYSIPHRKMIDLLSCLFNVFQLVKLLLREMSTLFSLEQNSGSKLGKKVEEDDDCNVWSYLHKPTSAWPESSGTLNSLVLELTSTEKFSMFFRFPI